MVSSLGDIKLFYKTQSPFLSISPPSKLSPVCWKVTGETSEVKRIDQDCKSHQTLDDIFQKSCSHLCHQFQNDNLSGLLEVSPLVGFFLVRMIMRPAASSQKHLTYHSISRSSKTSRGILLHYMLKPVMCYWRMWMYNGSHFLLFFPERLLNKSQTVLRWNNTLC